MAKKQVIRIGDTVRVVNNRAIERVGYPLIWYDLIEEVEADPRTLAAWDVLTGRTQHESGLLAQRKLPRYFSKAVAMLRVEERGFGGDRQIIYASAEKNSLGIEGQLHWDRFSSYYNGYEGLVLSKKVAKTGKRVAACGGVDSQGEYWEAPGGLDDCKTHVLLGVGSCWFAQEDVELVKRKAK